MNVFFRLFSCLSQLSQVRARPAEQQIEERMAEVFGAVDPSAFKANETNDFLELLPEEFLWLEAQHEEENADGDDILEEHNVDGRRRGINGETVEDDDKYPWQAIIYFKNWTGEHMICGGTIVDDQHIMTAAHCLVHPIVGWTWGLTYWAYNRDPVDKSQLSVRLGSISMKEGGDMYQVSKFWIHPEAIYRNERHFDQCTTFPNQYDIAIMKLDRKIAFSDRVMPLELGNDTEFRGSIGEEVSSVGFGQTKPESTFLGIVTRFSPSPDPASTIKNLPETLQLMTMRHESFEDCGKDWNKLSGYEYDNDYQFCVKSQPSLVCSGDSGSAVFRYINGEPKQLGIVSMLNSEDWPPQCDADGIGITQNAVRFRTWIDELIEQDPPHTQFKMDNYQTDECSSCCCYCCANCCSTCFPLDHATVETTQGSITMRNLRLGDMVKVNDGSFSKVVGFLHREDLAITSFVRLQTSGGALTLSGSHLLMTGERGFLQARDVKVGMTLLRESGAQVVVVNITTMTAKGYAAPLTETGTILVDGFQASCYACIPPSLYWLADMVMWPRRTLLTYNTTKGMDPYAAALKSVLLPIVAFAKYVSIF